MNPAQEGELDSKQTLPPDVLAASRDPCNLFGKYILIRSLGRGGMGSVYQAYDPELHRPVALKLLTVERADAAERFHREAQTVARLKHPNIVSIFEIGRFNKRLYLAMEFVEGSTLDELSKIPLRRVADLMREIAMAVQYAHDRGVIHRDLKPQNIIIDTTGRPYVTDFGLARELRHGQTLTTEGFTVGTPAYMSPEQATGQRDLDPRSDVYSLGAILYQLLCHRPPFSGRSDLDTAMNVVNSEPPRPSHVNPTLPPPLEAICLKAMAKDRRRRYASAAALAEDLHRWLRGDAVQARPPSFIQRIMEQARRYHAAILVSFLFASLLVALILLLKKQPSTSPPALAAQPEPTQTNRRREQEQEALRLLQMAKRAQDVADRIDLASRAIEVCPELAEAYLVRAEIESSRNPDRAVTDLALAAQLLPSPLQPLLSRAHLLLSLNRMDDAITDLHHVLELAPDRLEARCLLATAHLHSRHPEAALATLTDRGEHPQLLVLRSFALTMQRKVDEALELANRARPYEGHACARRYACSLRGAEAAQTGDATKIAYCLATIELEKRIDTWHALSELASHAVDAFRQTLESSQVNQPSLKRQVSSALAERGIDALGENHLKDARICFELARARDPTNPLAIASEGLLHMAEDRFDLAYEAGHQALLIDGTCLEGRLARGVGRLVQGVTSALRTGFPLPASEQPDPDWLRAVIDGEQDYREFVAHSPRWEKLKDHVGLWLRMEETALARVKKSRLLSTALAVRFGRLAQSALTANDPVCATYFAERASWLDSTLAEEMEALIRKARGHAGK